MISHSSVRPIEYLAEDLSEAGFTESGLRERFGEVAASALRRGHRAPAVAALHDSPDALAVLARFFVLGMPVPREALQQALPRFGVDAAVEAELVSDAEAPGMSSGTATGTGTGTGTATGTEIATGTGTATRTVSPLVELAAHDFVDPTGVRSWWIVSDPGEVARRGALAPDHVLGVGGASRTLAGLMMHSPVDSLLDLGTGSGIIALLASRFAARVVATDISARALRYARLNADLNGIVNVEFRRGDLFEPLGGDRFDRILSNPPFVITPRAASEVTEYEYRDAGMVGDALVEAIVRGIPRHLAPGGTAQLLGNWETRGGPGKPPEDGLDRIAGWADAAGLDSWVIERERQDPSLYAETWIRDGGTTAGDRFDELHAAWLADFAERHILAIGFGYVTLQHRSKHPIARIERIDGPLGHNPHGLGAHLGDTLAAMRRVRGLSDDELGSSRAVVGADVTEERHYWPGAEHPTVMSLHQGGGFGRTVQLDTGLAGLVGACDGELTIYAIIAALAELLEVDETELADEQLPRVRELVETGFLRLDAP